MTFHRSALTPGALTSRVLDLAFPARCAGCGREGEPLCASCLPVLTARLTRPPGLALGLPSDIPPPLVQLEWCAAYTGAARRALRSLKYAGERRLAEPLGRAMAERWRVAGAGGDLLVPVPVHVSRARERGFDQAELLAHVTGRELGIPDVHALERRRMTVAQFQLGRQARASNVRAAFALRAEASARVRGHWVILIDDVVTTGATLAACANMLLEAGALAVSALTVARER